MKQKGKAAQNLSALFPPIAAAGMTALLSFIFALFMQRGIIPAQWDHSTLLIALSISAGVAGALSGSGKKGLMIGALLALIWCLWRACSVPDSFFMASTLIETALCVLSCWLGSCIFHKKKRGYTKRNRKDRTQ